MGGLGGWAAVHARGNKRNHGTSSMLRITILVLEAYKADAFCQILQ